MKNKFYTKKQIIFLKENIDKFGVDLCAEKIGKTSRSVINKCYREFGKCNFKCHANEEEIKKLNFNDDFKELIFDFTKNKTPEILSYFIGYFWADGYVRKDGALVMEICLNDANDLEPLFNNLCSFTTYTRKRENKNQQKSFFYLDYDRIIPNLLKKLGKYPNSVENHEKILNFIPHEYHKYFIRGLIDGDGCLYISKENSKHHSTQLTISSRYNQNWEYLIKILKAYDIEFKPILREYKNYKSSVIRATNRKQIIAFLNKIYSPNDGIYLNRKYKKIDFLFSKFKK